ncbi:MAG: hypothetical protein HOY79_33750 [Streptomyces sp.]|nr:hypothetical protein [Streptomyces sp.]NUS11342.1 hypothetical protein [Streptomyces sp.]NUS23382.1 hypothetical protein [Streptomyces sp.]
MATVQLANTTEVVAWIAANVAKTIAADNHAGHDLDTVMRRMTTDGVLSTIRSAYEFRCTRGDDRPESIKLIGVRLIAEYCKTFGL